MKAEEAERLKRAVDRVTEQPFGKSDLRDLIDSMVNETEIQPGDYVKYKNPSLCLKIWRELNVDWL